MNLGDEFRVNPLNEFIEESHLRVLKETDLEDQINARDMADIICSPLIKNDFYMADLDDQLDPTERVPE